jgi:hypothetical protein
MKYSYDPTGNRTRDLPACSEVPQPTALPNGAFSMSESVGHSVQFIRLCAAIRSVNWTENMLERNTRSCT